MRSVTSRLNSFTFIELLVVIVIIAVLAGVSFPALRKAYDQTQLSTFTHRMQTLLNTLAQRAIVNEEPLSLVIDQANGQYWSQNKDTEVRIKTYTIPRGFEISVEPQGDGQILPTVNFSPQGKIDKVDITITNPDQQKTKLTTKGVLSGVKILQE